LFPTDGWTGLEASDDEQWPSAQRERIQQSI